MKVKRIIKKFKTSLLAWSLVLEACDYFTKTNSLGINVSIDPQ